MKKYITILGLAVCLSFSFASCKTEKKAEKKEKVELSQKEVYKCPMDCEKGKTYEKEGKCPVCHMNLRKVPKEKERNHSEKEHKH